MDLIQVVKELAAGGFATFLIAILVAGQRRVWVWGYTLIEVIKDKDAQLERERKEKEYWRDFALQTRQLADRSVSVAAKAVESKGGT